MPLLFHFPVMPRLWKAVAEGSAEPIRWILERTPAIPASCQWVVFLRNHDELTLEMVTEEERAFMYAHYAPEPVMRLNVGIRRRLAPLCDFDRARIELLHSLLMTLPGTPILYYGDEIGMGDDLSLPDRNGVRTPMQWDDGPGAGFSSAERTYAPLLSDGHAAPDARQRRRRRARPRLAAALDAPPDRGRARAARRSAAAASRCCPAPIRRWRCSSRRHGARRRRRRAQPRRGAATGHLAVPALAGRQLLGLRRAPRGGTATVGQRALADELPIALEAHGYAWWCPDGGDA
jgi:hypothetical protein